MIIKTPSRIHMALIDLNGSYGRRDGGIGLTISKPNFVLEAEILEKGISIDFDKNIKDNDIKNQCLLKIKDSAEKIISHFNIDNGFHFNVNEAFLTHSGLGSGTQISLATAKLICEYNGISINGVELGKILGRGGTSGVGIYSFDQGGLIIDGGHDINEKTEFLPSSASKANPPNLIGRYDFPKEWDILIAIPESRTIMGKNEVNIFQEYCPVPKRDVEKLSHLIFMNLIPFLLEKNIKSFGNVINEIQKIGFKKVELDLQKEKIKTAMEKMREFGAYGVGMSSFGPSIYGILDKKNRDAFKATKEFIGEDGIVFKTKAQNHGFELKR
ncbi:hypothetical protein MARBORIA2_03640 [Methanobrevibacter arboriphilus]|jgi:beta-ribofuranosylaminobenzene 5'-phosphate synthase|uniref:Uncharacterized protein n=1 Tax=Methanobrevibacter arboriphilus TaxID=39441 RepID=A0ACA8R1M8_METAZ|nr:beta-ribofuranosylaminobenzene 5'-phosphate synthase [Methanobrevibacter arboriphilus]BBL61390.1 hypothetical protein MarbSA_04300 [Methanobrevibacter arboriphilus]GLI11274.1 hypothetical protein MARBORIA2_03640 [Methanobrevibacter arboriphilus]